MKKSLIPSKLYKKIVESVPIVCVDMVLVHKNQYILVKRNNEPLKGTWWVVGGRMLKGENLRRASVRKVFEETGLRIKDPQLCGIYEDSYKRSAFGVPTHTVSIVFSAEVKKFNPKIDKQSNGIKLSATLPDRFLNHYESL